MSAVCSACGVAVVPGYVKCPKCHAALALGTTRRGRPTGDPGGTAVQESGFPLAVIVVPVIVVLVFVVIGVRGCGGDDDSATDEPVTEVQPSQLAARELAQQSAQPLQPGQPPPPPQPGFALPALPSRPEASPAIGELERALRTLRLWSTIEIEGTRIDVRSAGCREAAMPPALDAAAASLRGAGLTRLRCLAQSGAVVFEREL